MTVKFGVIGAGGIADRRTIPEGILAAAGCELAAVMDSDPQRARAVAAKYGVKHCFTRVEDLLAQAEIEAVYIATPNDLHKGQVIAAAQAGKHILVEKPIALSPADGQEMIAACHTAGVKLMVGYMMRFHAQHQWLKAAIDSGKLGQPVFGRAQLTCWYPEIPGAWRQDPAQGGGGALIDMGSHCLDLLEMLLGPVRRLAAFTKTLAFAYPVEDSASVLLEFESGAQGVVEVNFNVPDEAAHNALEIRGTRGAVLADHSIGQGAGGTMSATLLNEVGGYAAAQERGASQAAQPVLVQPVSPYKAEIEHFIDCIEYDKAPQTGGEQALRNLRLVQAAYQAARSGKVIDLA